MKYLFLLIFTVSYLFDLNAQEEKPLVVATASIFAEMADNIGGAFIEIQSIVPVGGDPHIYEPTPSDAILASKADLVLRNGLTFEGWLNELIENSGTKADLVLITKGIQPITSLSYENAPDPHAWMDAENGIIYAKNILDALVKLIPDKERELTFNYNAYKGELLSLHEYIKEKIFTIPKKKRVLITSHDAFQYYGRKYGLQLESILGTSTDAQAQTSDIVRLNKVIKSSGVPSAFIETTVNPKLLRQIAEDNDIEIGGKLFSDSIGDEDSEAPTYVDMLKYNTETIVNALSLTSDDTTAPLVDEETATPTSFFSSPFKLWLIPAVVFILLLILLYLRKRASK